MEKPTMKSFKMSTILSKNETNFIKRAVDIQSERISNLLIDGIFFLKDGIYITNGHFLVCIKPSEYYCSNDAYIERQEIGEFIESINPNFCDVNMSIENGIISAIGHKLQSEIWAKFDDLIDIRERLEKFVNNKSEHRQLLYDPFYLEFISSYNGFAEWDNWIFFSNGMFITENENVFGCLMPLSFNDKDQPKKDVAKGILKQLKGGK